MKVLVTCPPMLGMLDEFIPYAKNKGIDLIPVKVKQTLSVEELIKLVPNYDGWIIGDDPATRSVFSAGRSGNLKAAVKWGIGVDNVDFDTCRELKIPISNTPFMFGEEVADVALSYMIGLARQLYYVDREIRANNSWPKPAGISLSGKKVGVIGFGDIGENTVKRLLVCGMEVTVYDPAFATRQLPHSVHISDWPNSIEYMDFLVFTCSLNNENRHMLNDAVILKAKKGVYVINVARGPLIEERALIKGLESGHIAAAALDVFEEEPLPVDSPLRMMPQCIFGSHNGSNTRDAVKRASYVAMDKLFDFLNERK